MSDIINNNLGIRNLSQLKEIEYYLFNTKYHLIDDSFTFGETSLFTTDYLEKMHFFLFNDIYGKEMCEISNKQGIKEANEILANIEEMISYRDMELVGDEIYKLWSLQLFRDGNTRTILCFLKVASIYYNFKMTYDFTKDIDKDYFINEVIASMEPKCKNK